MKFWVHILGLQWQLSLGTAWYVVCIQNVSSCDLWNRYRISNLQTKLWRSFCDIQRRPVISWQKHRYPAELCTELSPVLTSPGVRTTRRPDKAGLRLLDACPAKLGFRFLLGFLFLTSHVVVEARGGMSQRQLRHKIDKNVAGLVFLPKCPAKLYVMSIMYVYFMTVSFFF